MCEWGVYLWCSLCTLCLLAWQVRVIVGDSGLCGGVCDVIGTLISRGVQFSSRQCLCAPPRLSDVLQKKKKNLYPLSWPFPHPSVPLLLFSGHRRKDMQIQSGRQPNRLSRRPRLAQLYSIFCFSFFLSFATTLPTKASFLLYFSFSLLFTFLSLYLTIPGIEEGTGDECVTVRNCT